MVGSRRVLLSIAVLSSLGVDNVLAGVLRRQYGLLESVEGIPSGAIASTSSKVTAAVAPTGIFSGEPSSSSPRGDASSSGPGALVVSPSDSAPAGEEEGSPAVFSTGGTLTANPTTQVRTAEPTKVSVTPGSTTAHGQPPGETWTSTTKVPPDALPPTQSQPGAPPPPSGASDAKYTHDLDDNAPETAAEQTTSATPTTAEQPTRTPPRGGPPAGGPPKLTTTSFIGRQTTTVDPGHSTKPPDHGGKNPDQITVVTPTGHPGESGGLSPQTTSFCQASDLASASTIWSIVYTSTITWYGNPEDYTPPYPTLSLPEPTLSCIVPADPPRLTLSFCSSIGTGTKVLTCGVTTTTESWGFGVQTSAPNPVVFLTTDKNPAVVYSTIRTPDYGVSQAPNTRDNHASPTDPGAVSIPNYNSQNPPQAITDSAHRPIPPTPITIGVQPTAVVINGNTITDNPSSPTQVVIVDGQTFTINPTQVIGAGAIVDRPAATGGGAFVPTPTSTNIGGVPVEISSSIAVIGGSSFTLGHPTPTTVIISDQTFTIGPTAISGGGKKNNGNGQTITLPTHPAPTEVVVAGGELITAIGASVVVIRSTTFTYATDDATTTIRIDDDETLTLGPGGVTAHGGELVLGGPSADPSTTRYALVGGATITKIGASVVVVDHLTYTLGPAAYPASTPVTLTLGGEVVTIAPDGVTVGTSLSLPYPFTPTTVIVPPAPGAGPGAGAASATGGGASGLGVGRGGDGDGDEEEDGAVGGVRPWVVGVVVAAGVAVVVGGWV